MTKNYVSKTWDGRIVDAHNNLHIVTAYNDYRTMQAGKTYVAVAFGCTGGRHRSVAAAVEMAERLRRRGFSPNIRHRDLSLRTSDSIEDDMAFEPDARI